MAKNTQMSNEAVNAEATSLAALLNSGFRKIYDGAQPANADVAVSTQNLLATLPFGSTAAASVVSGVVTFNLSSGAATSGGTATWYRDFKANGTSPVMDGNIGAVGSGANMELTATALTAGVGVTVSSATHTVQKATSGL